MNPRRRRQQKAAKQKLIEAGAPVEAPVVEPVKVEPEPKAEKAPVKEAAEGKKKKPFWPSKK